MNEQLQKELAAWLSQLREAATAGGSFVLEQAPLVVREYIAWCRASAIIYTVLGLVGLYFSVRFAKQAIKVSADADDMSGREVVGIFATIGSIGLGLVGGIVLLVNLYNGLEAWFAPRVLVLEWLASLVTKP